MRDSQRSFLRNSLPRACVQRKGTTHAPRSWLLALGLSGTACAEPVADPPDAESKYINLYTDDGVVACAGQLDAYDRFIERVFTFWDGRDPGGFRVAVRAQQESPCPVPDCIIDSTIYLGTQSGEYHELVHAVHGSLDGNSATALNEGLAQALGPTSPLAYSPASLAESSPSFFFQQELSATDYGHAGAWTRFAIERYDVDAYRDYFRAVQPPETRTEDEMKRQFELVFGEPFDEAWSLFVSDSRCAYDFWYCDEVTEVQIPWETGPIDCADPGALGFDGQEQDPPPDHFTYAPTRIVHLDSQVARSVTIELEHTGVEVARCGDCNAQREVVYLNSLEHLGIAPTIVDLDLDVGMYAFIIHDLPSGDSRFSIAEAL